jgi:hypothetical protein
MPAALKVSKARRPVGDDVGAGACGRERERERHEGEGSAVRTRSWFLQ